jgi:photosystem II stability/assembly factor-like uncharacterized protein
VDAHWRPIGPFRGGRVVAVAGDPAHPATFYFGACSGGVWKTANAGTSWENISDGFFGTASVGALAVAPSDPNVIYAGMGEACIRGDVTHGDGVYRSTDRGRTWKHLGLAETRHIGRVRIHPSNPDIAYVAALGHAFGPNRERGVYRTVDGGRHWDLVLHRNEDTGAIDLSLDPTNPRILYATLWQARRYPHTLVSGGPGSGIFRSSDGGDTWSEISHNRGLPRGVLGRMGISASPARSGRVFACIEAEDGGLFRSDDGGDTWLRTCADRELVTRAWYYEHVIADPVDADTVYVLNLKMLKFVDGGHAFTAIEVPHGDNHDLWIDPRDPRRMIEGNDGGACVSLDGGRSWSSLYNQPTGQIYHVTTDTRQPYRIYGAQQDNTTICTPSRSDGAAITFAECYPVGGGECGYIAVRPDDPDIVYAGSYGGLITRYDHRTRQAQDITVWPDDPLGYAAKDIRYRFQWTSPLLLSPHDPGTLYCAGNHVFRSRDEGRSWEPISPDLTRNDVGKQGSSGGPITQDNVSTEYYCTIFALAESPVRPGVLWAGSDDGLIHVSEDGGGTWRNVTPPMLPEWSLISIIEASRHDPAAAYVAATRYKHDDFAPYLLKTSDYGASWRRIDTGIATFTRCIREDPERRGLLYAGTESGICVSLDDGASWQPLQGNLPVVPVHDLAVKDEDLIAATHGRGFWVLDDLTPVRQWTAAARLFPPRPAVRRAGGRARPKTSAHGYERAGGQVVAFTSRGDERVYLDAGSNPPDGLLVQYHLPQAAEVTLTIRDSRGEVVQRFEKVAATAGLNRFVWNLRYPDAESVPDEMDWGGSVAGPLAPPGRYTVELGDQSQPFEIRMDARIQASAADLQRQFETLIRLRDGLSEAHSAVRRIRRIRIQAQAWVERAPSLASEAKALLERLAPIEEELLQVRQQRSEDMVNLPPKLNHKLSALAGRIGAADAAPTTQQEAVAAELLAAVENQLARLREVVATDLAAFNGLVRESGLQPVG